VWVAYDGGLLAGLAQWPWPGMSGLFPWVIAGGAAAFCCTAFMQSYCGLAARAPRYSRLLGAVRWLLLLTLSTILPWPQAAPVLRDAINACLLALGALALAAPVLVLRSARRPALFVLVGWAVTVAVLAWRARYNLGFGTADLLVVHGLPLAAAMLALVLSVALAERALDLRKQRDRAEFQRIAAESRLRVAQTRRALVEGLPGWRKVPTATACWSPNRPACATRSPSWCAVAARPCDPWRRPGAASCSARPIPTSRRWTARR